MGVMEGFLLLLSWGALQIVACVAPAFMPGTGVWLSPDIKYWV